MRLFASLTLCVLLGAGCSVGTTSHDDGGLPGFDGSFELDGGAPDSALAQVDGGPPRDAGPGCSAEETCANGLDDDCDGVIEESCACVPGQTAACFSGTASMRRVGACADGEMLCEGGGLEFGYWGPCEGDVAPADEVCDAEGVDESCDGAANEGCACVPGETARCGDAEGACEEGTQLCSDDGTLGLCVGAVAPSAEVCNDVDDDCDGQVDEGIRRACGTAEGQCVQGIETCVAGAFDTCLGEVGPTDELCDGLDNDCDGEFDEALSRACGSSVGECAAGTQACQGAQWTDCSGGTQPVLESCNGADDDCDGRTDEGISRSCGSDVGACQAGTETCAAGAFGACVGEVRGGPEDCDGGDEDCDGAVDEGCGCTNGATRSCGDDEGECVSGTQTCGGGVWGACAGGVGSVPEVCNSLDDDCDGSVDEAGICPTSPPIVSCPGDVSAQVLSTLGLSGSGSDPDGGSVTFSWTVTSAPPGSSSQPSNPSSASTNFFLDASGGYQLQLCVTDDEGEMACCSVNLTSVAPGAIHIEVNWNTEYGDVDAHLLNVNQTDPSGWFTVDDCHWRNVAPDWSVPGAPGNPTLDIDDTDGYGPENITIANTPAAGTYSVGLHYFCSHSLGSGAAPGDGPTDATVRVYCDGALIATYEDITLGGTDDWRTVAEIDYPSCVGRSRNRSTNGSSILPTGVNTALHCEIPCTGNSDCPSGERCARVGGGGPPRNICILE